MEMKMDDDVEYYEMTFSEKDGKMLTEALDFLDDEEMLPPEEEKHRDILMNKIKEIMGE